MALWAIKITLCKARFGNSILYIIRFYSVLLCTNNINCITTFIKENCSEEGYRQLDDENIFKMYDYDNLYPPLLRVKMQTYILYSGLILFSLG